ncbi:MAG TPA: hypothetical protein VIG73_02275 [Cerasibacillus sp.]|uniref:hypothetical protein n=1 Tax=Cerasibacillus sp. TaxID=2498711 RepID=UPI002F429674
MRKKSIMTLLIAITLLLATSIFFISQKDNMFNKETVTIDDEKNRDSNRETSSEVDNNENEEEVNSEEQDADIHRDDKDDPRKNDNEELSEFIAYYHDVLNGITNF